MVITSPGHVAFSPGRLSVEGTKPIIHRGHFNFATASNTPATTAAPPISHFIISMELGVGFKLNPPVSNTTPLPTRTIGWLFTAFLGLYSKTENVGGSWLPLFTASNPPILRLSICASLKTSTLKPPFSPIFTNASAKSCALSAFTGSFTKSRADFTAATIIFISSCLSSPLPFKAYSIAVSRDFFFKYLSN